MQGVTVRLEANDTVLCPVNALRLYLTLHPNKSGPLFTFQNKTYLSRADLNKTLRDTTGGIANISSHSLRIGAASAAAAMGYPKYLIQSMGRWTSDCFRRYIRFQTTLSDPHLGLLQNGTYLGTYTSTLTHSNWKTFYFFSTYQLGNRVHHTILFTHAKMIDGTLRPLV